MSNKQVKRYRGYGPGFVIQEDIPNKIVGRLCTLIDALGLKDTQEKSLKDLIRQEIYHQFGGADNPDATWIPGQLNNEIHYVLEDIYEEIKHMKYGSGTLSGNDSKEKWDPAVKGKLPWLDDYDYDLSFKRN